MKPTAVRSRGPRPATVLWAVGAFVVLAVVAAAVLGTAREPPILDPDTPEGVVQRYAQAVLDGDYREATAYLTEEAAEGCRPSTEPWIPESLSVSLDDVTVTGSEAEVRVRLRSDAGPPPFGDGAFRSDGSFFLVEQDDAWRITGSPWPLDVCEVPR